MPVARPPWRYREPGHPLDAEGRQGHLGSVRKSAGGYPEYDRTGGDVQSGGVTRSNVIKARPRWPGFRWQAATPREGSHAGGGGVVRLEVEEVDDPACEALGVVLCQTRTWFFELS
jgi:hypothetical protein